MSTDDTAPTAASRRTAVTRLLRPVVAWAASVGLVLAALRPVWSAPIQGDDFWLLFSIHAPDAGPWRNALDFTSMWVTGGTHFNPVGYFLDAFLKGLMLEADGEVWSATALHHGFIAAMMLLSLVAAADLLRALTRLWSPIVPSRHVFAVPVAISFLASTQLTARWANYDPLVTHPVYSSLTTLLGLTFLAAGFRALESRTRRPLIAAAVLGVLGFLVYEMFIVFVGALALGALLLWRRFTRRALIDTGLWAVLLPLMTLLAARVYVSNHDTAEYSGTAIEPSLRSLYAWQVSGQTSLPGSMWGMSAPFVDLNRVVPYAVAVGLAAGAVLIAWSLDQRDRGIPGTTRGAAVRSYVPVVVLWALAPVPFVVSAFWGEVLLLPGQSYMHSLTQLWAWAMAGGAAAMAFIASRPSYRVIGAVTLVVVVWVTAQVGINRQLGVDLKEHPHLGIDVTGVLDEGTAAGPADRCSMLQMVLDAHMYDDWDDVLNREYDERFGESFCSTAP